LQVKIVGVPVAETLHVSALFPHETQLGLPVVGVCKPYPEIHEVIVILVAVPTTVHAAALLLPHETQLGVPLVGEYKPYPDWHAVTVRLIERDVPQALALAPQEMHPI